MKLVSWFSFSYARGRIASKTLGYLCSFLLLCGSTCRMDGKECVMKGLKTLTDLSALNPWFDCFLPQVQTQRVCVFFFFSEGNKHLSTLILARAVLNGGSAYFLFNLLWCFIKSSLSWLHQKELRCQQSSFGSQTKIFFSSSRYSDCFIFPSILKTSLVCCLVFKL